MIRLALLLSTFLCLQACVSHPTMTITKDGQSTEVLVKPLQPIVGPDGIQLGMEGATMDWVDLAAYKSMGALPLPPNPAPQWACMAADAGTTGLALATGHFAEGNPLGIWVAPYSIGVTLWARHREKLGDPVPARWNARAHCIAAVWNAAQLLRWAVLLL